MSVTWWMVLIYDISQTSEFWIWKLKHEGDPDPPNYFIFHSFKMTWSAKSFNISYCYLYWKNNKTLHPTKIISVIPANLCFEGSYEMGVIKPILPPLIQAAVFWGHKSPWNSTNLLISSLHHCGLGMFVPQGWAEQVTESWSIPNWKGPSRIIESSTRKL